MKYLFLLVTSVIFHTQIPGQGDIFEKGVMAYSAGDYQKAAELFEEVLVADVHSKDLYYNLGLTYFELNQIGPSILNFERALKLDPAHEASLLAIEEVRDKITIPITHIDNFILWEWYRSFLHLFSSDTWSYVQLLSGVFILLSLYYFLLATSRKSWLVICCLCFSILSFLWSWHAADMKSQLESGGDAAILMISRSYIFKAPDERSEAVSEISQGTKVFLLDRIGDWVKVQLEDKDVGWIEIKKVEII